MSFRTTPRLQTPARTPTPPTRHDPGDCKAKSAPRRHVSASESGLHWAAHGTRHRVLPTGFSRYPTTRPADGKLTAARQPIGEVYCCTDGLQRIGNARAGVCGAGRRARPRAGSREATGEAALNGSGPSGAELPAADRDRNRQAECFAPDVRVDTGGIARQCKRRPLTEDATATHRGRRGAGRKGRRMYAV